MTPDQDGLGMVELPDLGPGTAQAGDRLHGAVAGDHDDAAAGCVGDVDRAVGADADARGPRERVGGVPAQRDRIALERRQPDREVGIVREARSRAARPGARRQSQVPVGRLGH
jgi:hypothetical protein